MTKEFKIVNSKSGKECIAFQENPDSFFGMFYEAYPPHGLVVIYEKSDGWKRAEPEFKVGDKVKVREAAEARINGCFESILIRESLGEILRLKEDGSEAFVIINSGLCSGKAYFINLKDLMLIEKPKQESNVKEKLKVSDRVKLKELILIENPKFEIGDKVALEIGYLAAGRYHRDFVQGEIKGFTDIPGVVYVHFEDYCECSMVNVKDLFLAEKQKQEKQMKLEIYK